MLYKLRTKEQFEAFNQAWLNQYKKLNPNDNITTGYCLPYFINGFYFVIKDEITEQAITDYIDIVDELPSEWHEPNQRYQVFMNPSQVVDFALSPYFTALKEWREQAGIEIYKDNGAYFYVNFFEQGHREIIEQFATITENMNYKEEE